MVYLQFVIIILTLAAVYRHGTKLKPLEKLLMGLKEDFQTLSDKVATMEQLQQELAENAQFIADDIAALKQELIEANERSGIDLGGLIQRTENINARATAINEALREAGGPAIGSDPEQPIGEG